MIYLKPVMCSLFFLIPLELLAQLKNGNELLVSRLALSDKKYEKAIDGFNNVIQKDSLNAEAFYLRSIAKLELGDFFGAEKDVTKAIYLKPRNVDNYIRRASVRDRVQNYQGAFLDYEEALKINKSDPSIYINRAISYVGVSEYEKAIEDCDKALMLGSRKEVIYTIRGISKLGLKKYENAVLDFNVLITNNRFKSTPYVRRATARYYLLKYELALKDIKIALRLDDENSYAYFQRAMIYRKMEKVDQAIIDLNRVIELNPTSATAYYNRASIFMFKGQLDNSLKDYDKVILLNSKNILAYYNRAIVFQKLNKYDKALQDVERAIQLYPDFVDAYKFRASIKKKKGDYLGYKQDEQTAEIIKKTKNNITDSLRKEEEMNLAKITTFSSGNTNLRVPVKTEISLINSYVISLLAVNDNKRVVDAWNVNTKTFTSYFLLNEQEKLNSKLNELEMNKINMKIKENPKDAKNYLNRAIFYLSLKQYGSSLLDVDASLRLDSTNYITYFVKANLLFKLLNVEKELTNFTVKNVEEAYDECLSKNPAFIYALFNRSNLNFLKLNYVEAIEDLSDIINVSPLFADAYLNRALILLILNNKEQACKDLSKAGELGKESAYYLINRYCN